MTSKPGQHQPSSRPQPQQQQGNFSGPIDLDLPEGAALRYAAPPVSSQPLWLRAYAWITVTLFCSLFVVVPLVTLAIVVGSVLCPLLMWPVACVWGSLAVIPCHEWPFFREAFSRYVIYHWMPMFQLRVVMDGPLPPQTRRGYLLGVHPHGIVPLGGVMYMAWVALDSPGVFGKTAAASIVLKMPVFRQLFSWLGMVPASKGVVAR